MSERKSRFRIKNEEIEIEYEGPSEDVNQRFKEVFEWLTSVPQKRVAKKKLEKKGEKEDKEERRGGARRTLFSPKIDELITENYFKLPDKRNVDDVMKTLHERGLPVTKKRNAILEALKRRLGKTLKGTKEEKEWVFWTE